MRRTKHIYTAVILLAAILITGCSNQSYDEQAINDYIEYVNTANPMKSATLNAKLLLDMTTEETTMKGKLTMQGEAMLQDDDIQMKLDAAVSFSGISINDLKIYMKDKYMYADFMGTKQKTSLEQQSQEAFDSMLGSSNKASSIDEAYIKEVFKEFKYLDDQKNVITFVINPDTIMKTLKEQNASLMDQDISIDKMEGTLTSIDGSFKDINLIMEMTLDKDTYKFDVAISVDKINQLDSIEFPDFSDYIETDIEAVDDAYLSGNKQKPNQPYEDLGGDDL